MHKVLKKFRMYDRLKQIKIDWITKYNRSTAIDFIDLSGLTVKQAAIKLAKAYADEIMEGMPISYDTKVQKSYQALKKIDRNVTEELDGIAERLQIDKYLLLAKEFLYVPDGCTSCVAKFDEGIFLGQNLDLGYSGTSLLLKKYSSYITVGLKSHPLWATTGINKHGVAIAGSSVNSIYSNEENIIPSVFNAKLILSQCRNFGEVTRFLSENKFYVGYDASSYSICDDCGIYYVECDSKNLFYKKAPDYSFTVNKFIELEKNSAQYHSTNRDAEEREGYLEKHSPSSSSEGFDYIKRVLANHSANICAHSFKSERHTTCSAIIDKAKKTLYFTKALPCKLQSKEDFFSVHFDD